MNDRIKWMRYKGREILLLDFSNLLEEKFYSYIKKATDYQLEHLRGEIYVLCDVTNTRTTPKIQRISRETNRILTESGIKQKLTTVGLNKMQRIIANAIKSDMYFAKDIADAKKWLINQMESSKQNTIKLNSKSLS